MSYSENAWSFVAVTARRIENTIRKERTVVVEGAAAMQPA
jgi:hypothetical protein